MFKWNSVVLLGWKRLVVGNAISLGSLDGGFMVAEDRRKPQIFTAPQAVIIQWPPRGTHLRSGHFLRLIIMGINSGPLIFRSVSRNRHTAFINLSAALRHGASSFFHEDTTLFCYVLRDALPTSGVTAPAAVGNCFKEPVCLIAAKLEAEPVKYNSTFRWRNFWVRIVNLQSGRRQVSFNSSRLCVDRLRKNYVKLT